MRPPSPGRDQKFFRRWLVKTVLGWLFGFVLIIVLATLWSGLGVNDSQFMVGLGMGAGVGFMQIRPMRDALGIGTPWAWMSAVGLALPFALSDLAKVFGFDAPFSLHMDVFIGGALVGLLQYRLLAPVRTHAILWIPACAVGWTLAAATSLLMDLSPLNAIGPYFRLPVFIVVVLIGGGAILGALTAGVLIRLGPRDGRSTDPTVPQSVE